jgi:hypothetical protein
VFRISRENICQFCVTSGLKSPEPRYNPAALRFQTEAQAQQFLPAALHCGNAASELRFIKSRNERQQMTVFRKLAIALLTLLAYSAIASAQEPFTAGTWTAVTNPAPSNVAHMLLLTDGSVLVNSFFFTTHADPWYRLIPDSTGSYINGTWVNAGTLPAGYNPLYFASQVLPNGQVVIMGGEYNNGGDAFTTLGATYNPKTNKWSSMTAPTGWTTIGDASSIVLPNGTFMLANCCTTQEALLTSLSPVTWTATGTGKFDDNDEEGWNLLPSGNVLTVDAYVGKYNKTGTNSELYTTSAGTWASAGSTIKQLWDSSAVCGGSGSASYEVGPAVLRPDGTVFATGANRCAAGHTAIYDTATATWSAGPDFPSTPAPGLDIADGPAALLPDGNVLLATSPGIFNNGMEFFEWDGTALNPVPGPPNPSIFTSFEGNMVCLPTGQILFTEFSTTSKSEVEIYTPSGTFNPAWQPVITHLASTLTHGTVNNVIGGTQFNGLSQCAAYGDDNQSATNWPLVRITNTGTGAVVYAKTHSFSTMGVATGATVVKAKFDIPATIGTGPSTLEVVANGIPSAAVAVTIN